ncbi:hypothetical protein HID58_079592 [Brassica napus]|uniref:Uncharacterized protein n=1 Tax=Brassica napus TaxID=3708 RepID=A0ABQ7Y2H3_BRANA|nr:hypothetical protein HID58_079592 [Brassica napus]
MVEKLVRSVIDPLFDLNQPAELLAAAEAIQDPPQAVEPQPQETINGQYTCPSNFRDRCALFGCEVALQSPQEEVYYCCSNHLQFSELWSSSETKAYQVYDGLEKDRREPLSFACLLLKLDGVDSGIPTLDTDLVFSKVPWETGDVFRQSYVPTYTSRDWFFFAKPPPTHKRLTSESGMDCQWHAQHHKLIPFDQQYIRSTTHNLRLSLYCLSHIVTPKEPKPARPSSKTTKTKAPDSSDDAQGEGEGSGEGIRIKAKSPPRLQLPHQMLQTTISVLNSCQTSKLSHQMFLIYLNITLQNIFVVDPVLEDKAFSVSDINSGWCKLAQVINNLIWL